MPKRIFEHNGIFYTAESPLTETVIPCAFIKGRKFSACYRTASCWMKTEFVSDVGELPEETQYVLAETETGYTLYFALCDGNARAAFFAENGRAYCRVETGDGQLPLGKFRYAYALDCENPYEGMERAYAQLQRTLGSFVLKKDKTPPAYLEYFGYCTYNAFYSDISHDKILGVEKTFAEQGLPLGFVIIDAGWMQSTEDRLTSFYVDGEKFPYGLKKTVEIGREEYGVKHVICWHSYNGFWRGLDVDAFPQYSIKDEQFRIPERFQLVDTEGELDATMGEDFYPMNIAHKANGICYEHIEGVYMDFYRALQEQGATGTKIDAITWVEAFAEGKGGRVAAMRKLLRAIENASNAVNGGNHINCSSCSNDFFMNLGTGSVVRTSCDYMPDKPLTNLAHVLTNAFVGMWVEPIVIADWDMFESGCRWGVFHATARALSGGAIYCTDKPEKADYALLKRLAANDGRVVRCKYNAKPTRACLFGTPQGEPFRVWNETEHAHILGAFGDFDTGATVQIPLNEAEGLQEGRYAVYSSLRGFLGAYTDRDSVDCTLAQREAELFTIVKIEEGRAVLGWTEKLNPSAYVELCKEQGGKLGVYTDEDGFQEISDF